MGRWRPLPGDLPPEVARLVRDMRRQMDRCEVNAATVAAKTGYSRSSWLRYLNGRRLPPWPAAGGLGRLAQADAEQLRVLWESAAHAWARAGRDGHGVRGAEPRQGAPRPAGQRAADGATASQEAPGEASGPASDGASGKAPGGAPPGCAVTGRPFRTLWRLTREYEPGAVPVATGITAGCALLAGVLLVGPWAGAGADRPPRGAPTGAPDWPWALDAGADKAAAACRSAGCRGLDPYRERCDRESVAVHRLSAYGRVLTLRYSPACMASWAEIDSPGATTGLRVATNGGDQQAAPAAGAYTAMVGSGPDAVRATVVVAGHQLGVSRYDSWVDAVTGTGPG